MCQADYGDFSLLEKIILRGLSHEKERIYKQILNSQNRTAQSKQHHFYKKT